jgi:uncharacterized phage protein (TIGR01671 family)
MNREIKFKVYHPTFGMMKPQDIFQMTSFRYDNEDGSKTLEKYYESDVKFLQYIGLKDKHENEIYEDDIVQWTTNDEFLTPIERRGVVVYMQQGARFIIRWGKSYYKEFEADYGNDTGIYKTNIEVIGNIHETPDLLNRSQHRTKKRRKIIRTNK